MAAVLPDQTVPLSQSLFCSNDGTRAARPAVSATVRERFARQFAANFAAAMTEHRHDDEHNRHDNQRHDHHRAPVAA